MLHFELSDEELLTYFFNRGYYLSSGKLLALAHPTKYMLVCMTSALCRKRAELAYPCSFACQLQGQNNHLVAHLVGKGMWRPPHGLLALY
jgi:hypothetical protein